MQHHTYNDGVHKYACCSSIVEIKSRRKKKKKLNPGAKFFVNLPSKRDWGEKASLSKKLHHKAMALK